MIPWNGWEHGRKVTEMEGYGEKLKMRTNCARWWLELGGRKRGILSVDCYQLSVLDSQEMSFGWEKG